MGDIYKATLSLAENDERRHTFYVRPFADDLKADLDRLVVDAKHVHDSTTVEEMNGTYVISTTDDVSGSNFMTSFWGMLFRRFYSESKQVRYDEVKDEKYYVIIFSFDFIKPCSRLVVA